MRRDSDPTEEQVAEVEAGVDLIGRLELQVERNRRDALRATHRAIVIALFAIVAFLLLAYRSEVNARQISDNNRLACQAGLTIILQSNAQQAALADMERADPYGSAARIKVYQDGRITPLPACR